MQDPGVKILCGAAVVLGFACAAASAQHRPAAWDTRVRTVGSPSPAPEDVKNPRKQTAKTKKTLDAADNPKRKKDKID
jgi:hypothetical protein